VKQDLPGRVRLHGEVAGEEDHAGSAHTVGVERRSIGADRPQERIYEKTKNAFQDDISDRYRVYRACERAWWTNRRPSLACRDHGDLWDIGPNAFTLQPTGGLREGSLSREEGVMTKGSGRIVFSVPGPRGDPGSCRGRGI
jgi:hypothetical protein